MKDILRGQWKPIYDSSKIWHTSEDYIFSDVNVQTAGRQSASLYVDAPYKPNFHILQYVTRGKGTLEIETETFSVQAGDLWYLPQDMLCCYYPDEKDPYEYYWVSFSGNQAARLLDVCNLSFSKPILHLNSKKIEKIFNNIFKSLFENSLSSNLFANSELLKLFSILAKTNSAVIHKQSHYIIDKALAFFEQNFSSAISVDEMCHHLGINTAYFSKVFKQQMNISPKLYLNRIRINHAKKLLSETDMPIKAIAIECGFSENAFIRTFSKLTNRTPLAYRKQRNRKFQ